MKVFSQSWQDIAQVQFDFSAQSDFSFDSAKADFSFDSVRKLNSTQDVNTSFHCNS